MTTSPTTTGRYRVICDGYTSDPLPDEETARNLRIDIDCGRGHGATCQRILHTIEVETVDGWTPAHIHRARQILAAPFGRIDTPDGPLLKAEGGWSRETVARDDVRIALDDTAFGSDVSVLKAALGPHEWAVLTADGRQADTTGWCACTPARPMETWVRYERYSPRGREAHGWLCRVCRRLTQTG